jgi:hypothetical protein
MCGRREEKLLFHRKKEKKGFTGYDPSICSPVLRCSICTGEQVAGFRDNATGKFRLSRLFPEKGLVFFTGYTVFLIGQPKYIR